MSTHDQLPRGSGRLQFGLNTLFAAMLAVAGICAVWLWQERIDRQHRALSPSALMADNIQRSWLIERLESEIAEGIKDEQSLKSRMAELGSHKYFRDRTYQSIIRALNKQPPTDYVTTALSISAVIVAFLAGAMVERARAGRTKLGGIVYLINYCYRKVRNPLWAKN